MNKKVLAEIVWTFTTGEKKISYYLFVRLKEITI
jgi:hypothetical protein